MVCSSEVRTSFDGHESEFSVAVRRVQQRCICTCVHTWSSISLALSSEREGFMAVVKCRLSHVQLTTYAAFLPHAEEVWKDAV